MALPFSNHGSRKRRLSGLYELSDNGSRTFQFSRISPSLFVLILILLVGLSNAWVGSPVSSLRHISRSSRESPHHSSVLSATESLKGSDESSPKAKNGPSKVDAAEQFHQDMRRVLASGEQVESDSNAVERHRRPVVLNSDEDGAERVLTMLNRLVDIGTANEESFQIVMDAFRKRRRLRWIRKGNMICAADQVEELLEDLIKRESSSSISMETYNMALESYAVCSTPRGERDYASKAMALLERMEGIFGDLPVVSYKHVLHAYSWQQANLKDGNCAKKASELLLEVEQRTDDKCTLMQSCALVLEAWSKSGSAGSADSAQVCLDKMIALNATLTDSDLAVGAGDLLSADAYINAILAWAKAPESAGARRSNELLQDMLELFINGAFPEGSEPELIGFNGVMSSWGRQGRADKAEEILRLMEQTRPLCKKLIPDAITYNSVLYAHLRSEDKDEGLKNALNLVKFMEENSHTQPAIKPNGFTYNTLLKCWLESSHEDVPAQAEATLWKLVELWNEGDNSAKPSNRVFNMVINAYSKSSDREVWRDAVRLLDYMKACDFCSPDVFSYTSVIDCLSKSSDHSAPEKAEELLNDAFELFEETGDISVRPNARTFTMVILTLARLHGSAQKAHALLNRLLELYEETKDAGLRPNEYPYNYVLNCAANTEDPKQKMEAFRIATQVYKDMRLSSTVNPDSFTYGFWLKCCNNLLPVGDLRTKCVTYSFKECKKEGLVTNEVLSRLTHGNSPELVEELLELDEQATSSHETYRVAVKVNDLPQAWTRNTR